MKPIRASFAELVRDDRGATAIEYALIAAFISICIVAGATDIGHNVSTILETVKDGFKGS